jgi:uncharacterized protein with GYD domain
VQTNRIKFTEFLLKQNHLRTHYNLDRLIYLIDIFILKTMSHYIILWKLTDQGIKNIKDSPKRVETFKTIIQNAGGKVIETYYTFGQYDGVSIVEASDDTIIMSSLLSIGSQGNASTVTLKAFTMSEAAKIIENLS